MLLNNDDRYPKRTDDGQFDPVKIAYLGLGSSLGDRVAHLQRAVDGLQANGSGIDIVRISSLFESPHMGLEPGDEMRYPHHLNTVIEVATTLTAYELLTRAQDVEAAGERQRKMRWGPRTIDVDILLYADLTLRTARLEIPHPGLASRAFVVLPLSSLVPNLKLPDGTPIRTLARSDAIRGQKIELFDAMLRLPI